MISLSSSKVESPRNATLSVMMKAKAQRSSRRDSSLECTLPAGGGGEGGKAAQSSGYFLALVEVAGVGGAQEPVLQGCTSVTRNMYLDPDV